MFCLIARGNTGQLNMIIMIRPQTHIHLNLYISWSLTNNILLIMSLFQNLSPKLMLIFFLDCFLLEHLSCPSTFAQLDDHPEKQRTGTYSMATLLPWWELRQRPLWTWCEHILAKSLHPSSALSLPFVLNILNIFFGLILTISAASKMKGFKQVHSYIGLKQHFKIWDVMPWHHGAMHPLKMDA